MSPKIFRSLAAQGYTHIPVYREISADLDTPVSAYIKLANQPYSYLFESVYGSERWGRYSIVGLHCEERVEIRGQQVIRFREDEMVAQTVCEDPLQWIEAFANTYKVAPVDGIPRFAGGLVGYFGYETIRYVEPKLARAEKPDSIDTPDILLLVSTRLLVVDNLQGTAFLIVHAPADQPNAYDIAQQQLDRLTNSLASGFSQAPLLAELSTDVSLDFTSGFSEEGFKQAVRKAREYIVAGDIMQVVLSQRLSAPFGGDGLSMYRHLRRLNPSPYMYYLNLGSFEIVGSSPEILVRVDEEEVTVRPIAGTRPRGESDAEDQRLEQELLADPKELAEHLMLIDLGRNDVGRVAQVGSVELTEKMLVERYSHVMHIVSNVMGRLAKGMKPMQVLRACFPAGTVSGAPKIRAMEIIDELEPVKRGVYSGAVGYLSWDGNMDTAIAIRTAIIKDNQVHIQAGAGVVYDSQPDNEWIETMNKAKAVLRAAALAERSGQHSKGRIDDPDD